jgi:hypothetical protein
MIQLSRVVFSHAGRESISIHAVKQNIELLMIGLIGEVNADLRGFPPSHAAMADGCVVKHKIECVGNADGTFHFEAGAPVRQVADHTIDHRPVTFEGDVRSLENTVARFIVTPLRRLFHCSSFLGPDRGSGAANA